MTTKKKMKFLLFLYFVDTYIFTNIHQARTCETRFEMVNLETSCRVSSKSYWRNRISRISRRVIKGSGAITSGRKKPQ